jgi:phage-related protein
MASKANVATAYVQVVPTTDGIKRELEDEFEKSGTAAGQKMGGGILGAAKSFIGPLAAAFAIGGAISFGRGAIEEASNLSESLNAVKVSFGDASNEIVKLGETAATRLGLSQNEFNSIATQFSAFAGTIAGSGGNISSVIDTLSTRGADFASVMNLQVSDALGLFQSGLAGETEPLRRYGIDLSAAAVEAYAMANGIGEAGRELTEAEKVQARYGSLLEQTNKVQGDFANTSDGLANSQRIANAQIKDAQASLGEAFLPILASVTAFMADAFVPILETVGAFFKENPSFIIAVATALGVVGGAIIAVTAITWLWNAALAANPITWIILGIAALVAAIVFLILEWDNVVKFLSDVFGPAMQAAGDWFTWLYEDIIKPVFDGIAAVFTFIWERVIQPWLQAIVIGFTLLGMAFTWLYENAIKPVAGLIGEIFNWIYNYIIKPVVDRIIASFQSWGRMFTWLYENVIKPVGQALGTAFSFIWTNVIRPVADFIVGAIKNIGDVIGAVFGGIGKIIGDAFNAVIGIVRAPVNAIIDLLNGMIGRLNGIRIEIPEFARDLFGGARSIGFNIAKIPKLATGGNITGSGTVMVGEAGPELLTLPKGARVTPLDKAGGPAIVYNAAPNASIDSEQDLFLAMRRAKVVVGW